MEARALLGLSVLVAYLVLGTILAVLYRSRARGSLRELAIAGGRLGGFLSAMTYAATTYSSFMIVGLVGFAYATGVGALGFELVYYVATLALLTLLSRRVWRMAREKGWLTPGEMISDLTGSRLIAPLLALVYLIALVPYAGAQLKGIGEAVAGLAGAENAYILGVILGLVVLVVWSALAGAWSVAVTDAFQGLWMLASATLLIAWLYAKLAGTGIGFTEAAKVLGSAGLTGLTGFWKPVVFIAFTLPWAFFAVTNPQVVQRLFMPRDERSLARMIRWFAVFGLYYTILVTLIGLLARAGAEAGALPLDPSMPKDQVTPKLLSLAHPLLAAIVFTSIVAASVSTADSILVALASEAANSVQGSEDAKRKAYYAALVAFAVAMAGLAAARIGYIVGLSVLSSVMLLGIAPPTLALWLGARLHPAATAAAVSIGPILGVAGAIAYGSPVKAFIAGPLGIPLSAWILLASILLTLLGALWQR